MHRGYFKHAETHLALRSRDMILNGFVDYLSMAVFRPMCLTHNTVFNLEAVDRDWLQTRAMHVSFYPSSDIIEIHCPQPRLFSARRVTCIAGTPSKPSALCSDVRFL